MVLGRREMRCRWTTGVRCHRNAGTEGGSAVSEQHWIVPAGGPVRAVVVWWRQEPDASTTRCKEVGRWRQKV